MQKLKLEKLYTELLCLIVKKRNALYEQADIENEEIREKFEELDHYAAHLADDYGEVVELLKDLEYLIFWEEV